MVRWLKRKLRRAIRRWKIRMIEVKLLERLKTVAQNVYYLQAPANYRVPCVVYNRVSTDPTRDVSDDDQDTAFAEFQIDVYSPDSFQAETLAKTIRTNLKEWQNSDVGCVAYTNKLSSVDQTTDVALYRVMTFFRMFITD